MTGLTILLALIMAQVRPDQLGHCANTEIIQYDANSRGACASLPIPGAGYWTQAAGILYPTTITDEVSIGGTTEALADVFLGADGDVFINKQGLATGDFQVSSDNETHAIFVDYTNDRVGLNGTPGASTSVHVFPQSATMGAGSAGFRVGGTLTTSGAGSYAWVLDTEMVPTPAVPNSIGGFNLAPTMGYDGVTQSSPSFWRGMQITSLGSAAWTGAIANADLVLVSDFSNIGAGVVTNLRGIAIEDLAEGASSNIALEIETQTVGQAIVTGTGGIDFGGDIQITSDSILNVAAHDYLPRSSGSPTFATVDTASVEVTGGVGSAVLFYSVAIPAQAHGELVNIRSITFYYALVNSGQIDFNKWALHTADGTSAYFDNDTVAIVAGTSHSVSALPGTLAADETLWFKISIGSPGATDEATLHGITITYDTD